ncbi:MAG: hypothetical protein SW019_17350 [Actinomycetota bacterium]|nr:hypothetical protein [Actinomycetota bacterium]
MWTTLRAVLLGDAAAGFLPTAGMAIESAWVLDRMLRRASRSRISDLLRAYEKAQRPRVEAAQSNSRQLAKVMFPRNRLLATVRDLVPVR